MTEDDHRYWTRFHIPLQMCLMTKQKSTSFLIHATSTEDFRGYTNHDKLTSAGLALYFTGFPVVGRTKTETARWTTWALVTTHLESAGIGSDSGKADQKLHLKHSNLDQKNEKPSLCPLCHMSYPVMSHLDQSSRWHPIKACHQAKTLSRWRIVDLKWVNISRSALSGNTCINLDV